MGCGKSSLECDSPITNTKKTDEEEPDLIEEEIKSIKTTALHAPPTIPFSAGGPLLAQAKISESQKDFFKMLDEKIAEGVDSENVNDKSPLTMRLRDCMQIWMQFLSERKILPTEISDMGNRSTSSFTKNVNPPQIEEPTDGSFSIRQETANESSFKEQYMFMGSLYTLTRLSHDGSAAPKIDVSPAPSPLLHERPAVHNSAKIGKLNGSYVCNKPRRLQRADTPMHRSDYQERYPSRPASLVLKKVFPDREANAT